MRIDFNFPQDDESKIVPTVVPAYFWTFDTHIAIAKQYFLTTEIEPTQENISEYADAFGFDNYATLSLGESLARAFGFLDENGGE